MSVDRVAVRQTIRAMENMVKALKALDHEFQSGNPERMALMMQGPMATIDELLDDLHLALYGGGDVPKPD